MFFTSDYKTLLLYTLCHLTPHLTISFLFVFPWKEKLLLQAKIFNKIQTSCVCVCRHIYQEMSRVLWSFLTTKTQLAKQQKSTVIVFEGPQYTCWPVTYKLSHRDIGFFLCCAVIYNSQRTSSCIMDWTFHTRCVETFK